MRDLLVEVGVEELPAGQILPTVRQFSDRIHRFCREARLLAGDGEPRIYATPRRLAVLLDGVRERQEAARVKVKGPSARAAYDAEGRPTRAAEGFARGQGVAVADLLVEETPQGPYVFALREEAERPAADLLREALPDLILGLEFARGMRWAEGDLRFLRPIRWLVVLYGEEVVPVRIGTIEAGRQTPGLRSSDRMLTVERAGEYGAVLEEAGILADPEARRQWIREGAEAAAAAAGVRVVWPDGLLDEVTDLVEQPTPFLGTFPAEYLAVPRPVLVTTMAHHQRYFPTEDEEGRLAPHFVAVRNGPAEGIDLVRAGNEKVLRARLADAHFFYTADRQTPLEALRPRLANVVYQERLGSLLQRSDRMVRLAAELADELQLAEREKGLLLRAAFLSKCDLLTHVVGEFPELQGAMGGIYATLHGEEPEVAAALHFQYAPAGASDPLPPPGLPRLLAMVDKLDALAGGFVAGLEPTGSQDPYGLRRQALGIVRMLFEGTEPLPLTALLTAGLRAYGEEALSHLPRLAQFVQTRLQNRLVETGEQPERVLAVLAADADRVDRIRPRLLALGRFLEESASRDFVTTFRRVTRLAGEEGGRVDPSLLQTPEERELHAALGDLGQQAEEAFAAGEYGTYLHLLSRLKPVVDRFFDGVLVMAEDAALRQNRLALLGAVGRLMGALADFTQLPTQA